MALNFLACIELRGTQTGIGDATIYASTNGAVRTISAVPINFPPVMELTQSFVNTYGRVDDPLQTPGRLGVLLQNDDFQYSEFLPNGDSAQFWDLSPVTIYDAGNTNTGDALTDTDIVFKGFIAQSTLVYIGNARVIEFDVLDIRTRSNPTIASQSLGDNPTVISGANITENTGQIAPQIIGDWTADELRIPAFKIGDDGVDPLFAVCNHKIGTVSVRVVESDGTVNNSPTLPNTDYDNGAFTISAADAPDGSVVTVQCVGYPDDVTDTNPVRLIQFLLTQFAGVLTTEIFNPVDDVLIDEQGSFRKQYDAIIGATPEYDTRLYINDGSRALDTVATVAVETNFAVTVEGGQYRIFEEVPSAPTNINNIPHSYIDIGSGISQQSDPDTMYANAATVGYAFDPATGQSSKAVNTDDVLTPDDVITKSRNNFGEEIRLTADYISIFDTAGIQLAVVRRLFWRSSMPQHVTIRFNANDSDNRPWDLTLNADFRVDFEDFDGQSMRVDTIEKNPNSGAVTVRARNLFALPVAGVWTDDLDEVNGEPVDSKWTDDNDETPTGTPGHWI